MWFLAQWLDSLTGASAAWEFRTWFQVCASTCSIFAIAKFAKSNDPLEDLEDVMFNVCILKKRKD